MSQEPDGSRGVVLERNRPCQDAASGPLRVAEPARVVLGDPAVLTRTTRRPPIRREEMTESAHPVESAYDKLKEAVRHASLQPPTV